MGYKLKIFAPEDVTQAERQNAEERFRYALENSLGDESLVLPVYQAYLRLLQAHGDNPRPWPITPAEQLLADQWEAAELAATQAAFGVHRYMGDAQFELLNVQTSPNLPDAREGDTFTEPFEAIPEPEANKRADRAKTGKPQ